MKKATLLVPVALIVLLTAAGLTVRFSSAKGAEASIASSVDIVKEAASSPTVSAAPTAAGIQTGTTGTSGGWVWPCLNCKTVTAVFGNRYHPILHKDVFSDHISIGADEGDTVLTAFGGSVSKAGTDDERGNYIVISDGNGVTAEYRHLKTQQVSSGGTVKAGDPIGTAGSTGNVTGPCLDFAVFLDGEAVDPLSYFKN